MNNESKQPHDTIKRPLVPVWVALAGLLVAFICGAIILLNAAEPLYFLVFPEAASPPLPPGAVELEHIEASRIADTEWVYGINMSGCEVAQFYMDQGSTCRVSPLACDVPAAVGVMTDSDTNDAPSGSFVVATCEGTHTATFSSYSWLVDISSGYDDYDTKFRVFLFTERD